MSVVTLKIENDGLIEISVYREQIRVMVTQKEFGTCATVFMKKSEAARVFKWLKKYLGEK